MRFYVNQATGSDTLDAGRGESESKPFKTIQACTQYVADNYNISRYTATILVAAGTYIENVKLPKYNATSGHITILGASSEDEITTVIQGCIYGDKDTGLWYLQKLKVENIEHTTSLATQGYYGIASLTGSVLYIIECSVDISKEGPIGKWKHAVMADGGMVQIRANSDDIVGLHVNGGDSTDITSVLTAQNSASVTMMADIDIYISDCSSVITVSEGSVFKVTTLADSDKPKFTGTATGRRYNVRLNGIINTIGGGNEFIIGTIDGLISSGGQYA